ncbi:MAG: sulfite exporter TauE/SafE family protein [Clostridia bacterium]|nr:sulfite exporter TauE/SafE family protein [Clostridia bacterium]
MQYLVTFLEGLVSFISPCVLPVIPVYISFISRDTRKKNEVFIRALGFVMGLSVIYIALGFLSGAVGSLIIRYRRVLNIITGIICILLAFVYMDIIKIKLSGKAYEVNVKGFFSAFLFGMLFSINITPCSGAFLGSAIMMASNSATVVKGALLLLCYALGLAIPFMAFAFFISYMENAVKFIKNNYGVINKICGIGLMIIGALMILGVFR